MAALPLAASAYTIADYSLTLGFRDVAAGSASTLVQADLGWVGTYTQYAGSSTLTTFTVGNINASLTQAYGAEWNTSSTLRWGIIGGTSATAPGDGLTNRTAWISQVNVAGGDPVAPPYRSPATSSTGGGLRQSSQATSSSAALLGNLGYGLRTGAQYIFDQAGSYPHLIGPDEGVLIWDTNSTYSGYYDWYDVVTNGTGNSSFNNIFGTSGTYHLTLADFEQSVGFLFDEGIVTEEYRVVDLWQINHNNAAEGSTYIGSFGLTADGDVIFANQASFFGSAVPEPSTYALMAGALALAAAACRRRRQQPKEEQILEVA